jgi:HAE1 family hydrophobic/amphiphilic exporter-1
VHLAELSLKRPITTIMFFISLTVVGLIAAFRLPLEFMPAVDAPFAFIQIPYPGSTPQEVERTITRPVEESLATLSGVKRMFSNSSADNAQVFMEFEWGADPAIKASEARERIDAIRDELPEDLQRYFVFKFSTGDQPVLRVRIASEQGLGNEWDLLDRKFKRPIERLPGVARVDISGVGRPEVAIELLPDRIAAHNIALNDLNRRLQAANFSVSAGVISDAGSRFRVQPIGEFGSLDDIRGLVVDDRGLRLGDIAEVTLKPQRLEFRRRLDLQPAVGIDIFRERTANLVEVSASVLETIERAAADPELAGIEVYVLSNQGAAVTSSLGELLEAGLLGSLMSLLVLYLFLRHWPSTLMVSLAVPLCIVITLGLMYFFGVTLNILSMMGLLLGVGMVVDNAVVAVESIYQQRRRFPDDPPKASIIGIRQVAIALSAGTLSHCIVFLPNIFGETNMISIYLAQVAIAISISLLASWLVAVTLVPMLSARIPTPPSLLDDDTWIAQLKRRYERYLDWSLAHPGRVMLATGLLLAVSFVPMTLAKKDMFPEGQTRELELEYQLNGSYTLDQVEDSVEAVERYLLDNRERFEIRSVYSAFRENGGQTDILLVDDGTQQLKATEIMDLIREDLPRIAIGEVGFGINQRAGGQALQVNLFGDSNEQLRALGDAVIPMLRRVEGMRDVRIEESTVDRELAVRVDRERAAAYGFSAQEVASYIAIALRGAPLREFRGERREIPVWLRFAGGEEASVDNLRDFKLTRPDGTQVPLLSLVEVRIESAAGTIRRQDRQTALPITVNAAPGTDMGQFRRAITEAMDRVPLPPGYRWSFGGGFNFGADAGRQMAFNTLIALLLILIVMAAVFESLLYPVAIVTTILFSICGVFWLFWLTGTTFSIMAAIGILVLMGVVVNNGIVMVEHINQLRLDGLRRSEALIAGARDRLRPVLMTTATTVLGMLPLCFSSTQIGGDGPPYYPMARAIVGGLVFSTIVTLLVLPVIYALLDDLRLHAKRTVRAGSGKPGAEPEAEPVVQGA